MSAARAVTEKSQEFSRRAKLQHVVDTAGRVLQTPDELRNKIAVAAYYRAERRNFEPGGEMEDWLDAEAEVLAEQESLKGMPA